MDGVMARPTRPNRPVRRSSSAADGAGTGDGETDVKAQSTEEDEQYERELAKWEAWNRQAGLSRYEAKRKYIETLIEIMNVYTHTR